MPTVAEEILTFLATGADPLNVHDTVADVDDDAEVVKSTLPYVVFMPLPTEPRRRRRGGGISSEPYAFQVMFVGLTRAQCDQVRDRTRARLEEKRPQHDGTRNNPITRVDSLGVQREQTYHAPGGRPLMYGVDRYTVEL